MTDRAATSSSYHWPYDVFINFRGEDTRLGFTGNLNHALTQKGVYTFFDDKEIRKGDEITPTLVKAIEGSRMAITVFSKNYASSTFCLDELVKIHQCIKQKGRLVWPIFYDVEPSEVRHQRGNYERALAIHRLKANEEKIQSWKSALHEVANLCGTHLILRHGEYEHQVIQRIVIEIFNKLNRLPLYVTEHPVGLDSRLLRVNSLLQLVGSNDDVIMIGIHGFGGLGKTTIARAVYNSIADNFECACFLYDIKGNSSKHGLEQMQERMLSKILGVEIKIDDTNEGVPIIKERFKTKKILLILDNVDKQEQLQKLAGYCDWFGSGSRIIITTRDKQLLVRHGVHGIYGMEGFNDKESLELLSWNAFKTNSIGQDYLEVLNGMVHYSQGLPLALQVIGSHLFGMSVEEWKSALEAFKRIPHRDIQKTMKLSYDGLNDDEKEIFLDIACFYKGCELEYVIDMIKHAHGFDPRHIFKVLVNKCLINIEKDQFKIQDCITVHDLIRDMGREVVRQESPNEPGKRSRLWSHQDIVPTLENNSGTDKVRIIVLDDLSESTEVKWDGKAFKKMKNLKILVFKNLKFAKGPKYLPNNLKVLKWPEYPLSLLPPNSCTKKLVVFDVGHSGFNSLETIKKMSNVSVLNLGGCNYITQIPNLSSLHYLKELRLKSCTNLIQIDDSVGELAELETLDVRNCFQLETFPSGIKLPSLKAFLLENCRSLKYFPEILIEKMKVKYLNLSGTGIEKLPLSIRNLHKLETVEAMFKEKRSFELPSCIFLLPEFKDISVSDCGKLLMDVRSMPCPSVRDVSLSNCNISDEILRIYLTSFTSLICLDLGENDFTCLPACIEECRFLVELYLAKCKHLREVEGIPPNIKQFNAVDCISLSVESRNLLLGEELLWTAVTRDVPHVDTNFLRRTMFFVLGGSIPNWIDKCTKGQCVSFWFRNHFPTLCGCALLKPVDHDDPLEVIVVINKEPVLSRFYLWHLGPNDYNNIAVYDLKRDYFDDDKMKRAFRGEWNHAEVYLEGARKSGIYVIKQQCNMDDIRFTNPYESMDSISSDEDSLCDGGGGGGEVDVELEDMEQIAEYMETMFNLSIRSLGKWADFMLEDSIPEWFDKHTKGPCVSFWFRNNFPTLCGGALLQPDHDLPHKVTVFINEEAVCDTSFFKMADTAMYGLKMDHFDEDKMKQAFQEGEWNYAEIYVKDAKESGIYVTELQCNKENILFTDPYINAMVGNQDEEGRNQCGARLEKNRTMLNKKRPLIEDDNFASSSTHFRCTKRRGISSTNQEENNANLIEINIANATETIGIQEQELSLRSKKDKGILHQMNPMQRLSLLAYANNFNSMTLSIEPVVMGKNDMIILVEQEDLVRLLMRDRVTIQMMHVFLIYLHRLCTSLDKSEKFGFICPLHIQNTGNEEQIKLEYLQIRLSEGNQECYLAPYVHSDHWQLIILCPKLNTIVFLCSTHNEPRKEIKKTMNTVMMTYQTMKEKKKSYQVKEPKWIVPKSRKQPMLSAECGYYIMSHMVNIITLGTAEFSVEMFDNTNPLSSDELKDVCTHWARGFLEVANL